MSFEKVLFDDSSIYLEEYYPYKDLPDRTFYEVLQFKSGKKIILYLVKKDDVYKEKAKSFATHILEQIFDNQGNIVSEEIKPFTY